MASRFFLALMLILFCFSPCIKSRKLLNPKEELNRMDVKNTEVKMVMSALPRGREPPSAASKIGNSLVVDQKLLAMHYTRLDRILKSVPSPGVGH